MTAPCEYCGATSQVDVLEVWPDERAVLFAYCCEALEREVEWELTEGHARPDLRAALEGVGFATRGLVTVNGVAWAIDFGLDLGAVTLKQAKAFVRQHHRHRAVGREAHNPPVSWRWGHALYNGRDLVAVAMVGRPVARMIDGTTIVEVNRLAVREDLGPELTRHACSKLYAAAAREAKRRGFAKIITYTLETEAGTSLKAVAWEAVAKTKGGSWSRPSRERTDKAPTCRKVRWEKALAA